MRGGATGGWPEGREEWLPARRAMQLGEERESQITKINTDGKTKITVLIRCANAKSVLEKPLASPLADAFSQHIPDCKPSATPHFLPKISGVKHGPAFLCHFVSSVLFPVIRGSFTHDFVVNDFARKYSRAASVQSHQT